MPEWSIVSPSARPELAGLRLNATDRAAAQLVTQGNRIELLELADGLEIRTTSWVGRLALGGLDLTVVPKINGAVLADLLRYSYGLRELRPLPGSEQSAPHGGVQDLLAWQLAAEAEELLARGLHRDYRIRRESISSPRGRIDVGALALTGLSGAALPCIHYPRMQDNPVNRGTPWSLGAGRTPRLGRSAPGPAAPALRGRSTQMLSSPRSERGISRRSAARGIGGWPLTGRRSGSPGFCSRAGARPWRMTHRRNDCPALCST